ncbi:MAG: hypothetical protein KC729_19930, partial [Candidatus Eisenbacteria bacterium]|nr:hypothetical protein [Candidatus Eisenbacteria bacterium]
LPSVVTRTRDPLRRGFHALLALGGWAIFLYLWWTIFVRGFGPESWIVLAAIAILIGAIALLNLLWVRYNEGLARMRTPRTHVRVVATECSTDSLGRNIEADWSDLRRARSIWIEVDPDTHRKVYRTVDT